MQVTYKYRIKDRHAAKLLRQHAYAVNQVWNWCVAEHNDNWRRRQNGARLRPWLTHFDMTASMKGVGQCLGLHQQTVGLVCRQFVQARTKRHSGPGFRRSFGNQRALGWVPFLKQSRQIDDGAVRYLGKSFRVFGLKRRPIPKGATGGCFVEDARGRWSVVLYVEREKPIVTAARGATGIDLGIKTFAALSGGERVEAPPMNKLRAQLAVAQRARRRDRARVINQRMKNVRRDFQHKLSTRLSREYAFIAVGNVRPSNLSQMPFAGRVYEAGWTSFRKMLAYKAASYVEVDEKFTTQTCSGCGSISGPKGFAGLNEREWMCPDCGACHDRDVNSARVILSRGLSVTPPEEGSRMASAISDRRAAHGGLRLR